MAIEKKTVCVCDICGFVVEAVKLESGALHDFEEYVCPDTWSHGKADKNIDICPRCARKLERPEWNPRGTRDVKGFKYGDIAKK